MIRRSVTLAMAKTSIQGEVIDIKSLWFCPEYGGKDLRDVSAELGTFRLKSLEMLPLCGALVLSKQGIEFGSGIIGAEGFTGDCRMSAIW